MRAKYCSFYSSVDHERVFKISVNKEREEKLHKGSIPVFKNIIIIIIIIMIIIIIIIIIII